MDKLKILKTIKETKRNMLIIKWMVPSICIFVALYIYVITGSKGWFLSVFAMLPTFFIKSALRNSRIKLVEYEAYLKFEEEKK